MGNIAEGQVSVWEFSCPLCGSVKYIVNPDPDVSYRCRVCKQFRGKMDYWDCDEYVKLHVVFEFDDVRFKLRGIAEVS